MIVFALTNTSETLHEEANYYFQLVIFAKNFSDISSPSLIQNVNFAPNNARKSVLLTYLSKNKSEKKILQKYRCDKNSNYLNKIKNLF